MLNILYNNMKLRIRKPNDFHHHLRDGEILKQTVSHCFSKFKNVVVMPNLKPPIISIQQAMEYKERIKAVDKYDGNPMMTLYLHKNIYNDFLDNLINRAKKIKLGDPMKDDTQMGP